MACADENAEVIIGVYVLSKGEEALGRLSQGEARKTDLGAAGQGIQQGHAVVIRMEGFPNLSAPAGKLAHRRWWWLAVRGGGVRRPEAKKKELEMC